LVSSISNLYLKSNKEPEAEIDTGASTQVIANYGPSIYGGLGYGTADQLYFSAGWLTSGLIANFISAFIMDLTGRVKLMIIGLAGCEIALIGAAVTISLNERAPTYGIQVAAVFFIFLHLAL
jgi:MFS family permease